MWSSFMGICRYHRQKLKHFLYHVMKARMFLSILHLILPLAEYKKPFDMGPHEDWVNPLIRTEGSLTLHCTWLHLFSGSNFMRCRASSRKCYLGTKKYVISCSVELWCVAYTSWSMTNPDSMLCQCRLCFTKGFMQFTSSTRSQSFRLAKSCERNWEIKCKAILLLSLWNFMLACVHFFLPSFWETIPLGLQILSRVQSLVKLTLTC